MPIKNKYTIGKNPNSRNGFKKGNHPKTEFKKGQNLGIIPWNKEIKRPEITDEKHPKWKGDDVSYSGLHKWIQRKLGKPKICKHCEATYKERKLSWANKDHKYRRILDDWISLCYSCHLKYDYKFNKKNDK